MKRHERTHTKEKPYKCTMCSYTASRSDHLRRHLKIHYKNICATNSSFHSESTRTLSDTSASTSPVMSPSPVLSASSSPSLTPLAPSPAAVPYSYLGTNAYDDGGECCGSSFTGSCDLPEIPTSVLPKSATLGFYSLRILESWLLIRSWCVLFVLWTVNLYVLYCYIKYNKC